MATLKDKLTPQQIKDIERRIWRNGRTRIRTHNYCPLGYALRDNPRIDPVASPQTVTRVLTGLDTIPLIQWPLAQTVARYMYIVDMGYDPIKALDLPISPHTPLGTNECCDVCTDAHRDWSERTRKS
jgi:hypothetical protein